jgi:hypothetical protein
MAAVLKCPGILLLHYCLYVCIVSVFSFIFDVQYLSPVVTVERWQSLFECSYFGNCCIHNRAQYISVGYALTIFYFPVIFKVVHSLNAQS